ncbi:NADH oxidoreductase hcr [Kluyvera cryocrescens]|uniref:NADH oxidoreductase hcr n=1 Tax=Kluyvera cryocrescens TaxID=580 RepID=A0A485AB86_KLUCR|nr:NADH oxidoreductase hcr [Kluyvera cryocrescens]
MQWVISPVKIKQKDKFLMLAAGCGVTPIMSMRRWLAKYRPQADVQVIFNVRSPDDVIFADEWRQYPVTLVAENNATHGFVSGRLSTALLQSVPDLASRTVMTCGPAPYMDLVEKEVKALGVTRFFKEKFFTPVAEAASTGLKFTKLQPAKEFYAPVGTTLLDALESNQVPVVAACRAGVLRLLQKLKWVSGEYTVDSTMTLTDAEIAEGYVLACSCHPQGDLVLA